MSIYIIEPIDRELRGKEVSLVGFHKSQIALTSSICGWEQCLRPGFYVVRWGRFQQANCERSHLFGLYKLETLRAGEPKNYYRYLSVRHSGHSHAIPVFACLLLVIKEITQLTIPFWM